MRSENPATQQSYTIEEIISSSNYQQAFSKPELLLAINVDFNKTLHSLCEQINEGVNLYNASYVLGGNQLLSDKKNKRNLKKIKRMIKEKPLQEVSAISREIAKEKLKRDFIVLHHMLREKKTWQKLEERLDRNSILDLKEKWLVSAKFSHFTLSGLMNVIEILEYLQYLLDAVINEFELHKAKISLEEQRRYSYELGNFREKIRQEKKHIANNLYQRCQSAMFSDARIHPSLVFNLLNNLFAMGGVNKKFVEDMSIVQGEEESIDFSYAFYYASKHASTWIKDEIEDKLSLTTYNNNSVALTHKKIDNNQYLIPHSLIKYIPHKKPYWFFLGKRQRYQFFKDKGFLLISLIAQQNKKIQPASLEDLLENSTWQTLANLQKELERENQQVNKLINSQFGILRRASLSLYKEWQEILIDQQRKICKSQIDFLIKLAKQPRPLSELFEKPCMDNAVRQQITDAISKLSSSQAFNYLPNEDKEKFYPIQASLIARCKNDQAIEGVNSVLAQLANNASLNEADFTRSQQYLLKLPHERLNKHFKNNKENIDKIFANIIHVLSNVIDSGNVENYLIGFSQQVKILKAFLHISKLNTQFVEKLPIYLDNFISKYAEYLKNTTQETVLLNKVYLEQLEETVNTVLMTIPEWKDKVQAFTLSINARLLLQQGIKPMLGRDTLKLAKEERYKTLQLIKQNRKERVASLAKLDLLPIKIAQETSVIELSKDAQDILESAKKLDKSAHEACKRFQDEREARLIRLNKIGLFENKIKEEMALSVSNIVPNI